MRPLQFDALTNTTASGQTISITRLDFLVSDLALEREDGSWVFASNSVAFVSGRIGRTSFNLSDIPAGLYRKLRFHIGLPASLNHADPSKYPAGHPLHPDLNGLHWGWMGGYVFLAVEGNWLQPAGPQSGYSYHLATDRLLMTIELPLELELSSDAKVRISLNTDRIFDAGQPIQLTQATASTHSRTNDSLAIRLHDNVEKAFAFESVNTFNAEAHAVAATHLEIAPDAHPYSLTISALFPRPALPNDNPLTQEGVELGRRLFFDPQLSINNAQSCASCHQAGSAFSETKTVSVGAEGKIGTRNAMPLLNLAWKSSFFWDGRAASLREQVLQPIQNPIEMHESLTNIEAKLSRYLPPSGPSYALLFEQAFGTRQITADRIARALEQFLLTQTSHDSKFDRVLRGEAQFTEVEQRGFELFHTEYDPRREQYGADCFHCHGGPLFQSQSFANNGLDSDFNDLGRSLVTGKEGDKGKFSVPSLRNVELTAPYMHDGRFKTLEETVEHYSTGLKRSTTLDPNLAKHPEHGIQLSAGDKTALVAFLKTLTDERFRTNSATVAKVP